ncbi:hypothetical protein GCM10008018_16440 [Paenibacillus marchantiophytorum]|uniref:PGAP2IP C-terminal nuclease-like domain-containing protein n=1 Tax=Paenibacillus marchantiophytorum TaxID=1619310 RepID=A0ABQ2BS48_9BACL|nr:endonuclease/exonuclease/phosphatase family protein [Paenibacillus marchantiophytorum]GGI46302.1 hypothetical protein GCM10008018_16440 [Paenibacillus marchantiophytorum]
MGLLRHIRNVSSLALLILLMQLAAISSEQVGLTPKILPAAVQTTTPAGLTIMTFNIHHGEGLDGTVNMKRIAALIAGEQADIIALQEVDRYRLRSGFVDQAKELADLLGMQMVFAPSLTYMVGQYGNVILSRFPIKDHSYELLPGKLETRSLLTATIQVGSESVQVAATHLGLSQADRTAQLARISEILAGSKEPQIVAGDFNMELESFLTKMDIMKLTNIPLRPTMKATLADGKSIDDLFTNWPHIGSAWTIPTNYSDHFPVITRIPLGSWVRV